MSVGVGLRCCPLISRVIGVGRSDAVVSLDCENFVQKICGVVLYAVFT